MKKIREIRILDLSFWPNLSYFFRIFVITMKVTEHYQTSLRGRRWVIFEWTWKISDFLPWNVRHKLSISGKFMTTYKCIYFRNETRYKQTEKDL